MQAIAHVDPNLVLIIEALVLFFIAAEFLPVIQRNMPDWMRLGRRPSLVPATIGGIASVEVPEMSNGNGENELNITDLDQAEPGQAERGQAEPGKEE